MKFDASEARDENGEWTAGGGAGQKPAPASAPASRVAPPKADGAAAKLAQKHPKVDATVQRYCEEHNEGQVAAIVGGRSLPDSEPIDVRIPRSHRPKHGIELKTMVFQKAGQVRMKGSARARKGQWEKDNNATLHTVVIDDRKVFNANGPGQHDESKRVIFYRRGFGSFSVSAMQPVRSMAELNRLIKSSDDDLPKKARRKS